MTAESPFPENVLCYGSAEPLPASVPLRAGPLHMVYEQGALRYIKAGNIELLRMVYVALRDKRWGSYVPHITNEKINVGTDAFQISFTCCYYLQQVLLFSWDALLTGDASGKVYVEMKGEAQAEFEKNRLGICVLHPVEPCKGKKIIVTHADQTQSRGCFPVQVSPHQPFKNIRAMEWFPDENFSASVYLEGDIFEMEDQRNWTDASYKTYSTPLEIPFPVAVKKSESFFQAVTLQVAGNFTAYKEKSVCTITPEWQSKQAFPALGISRYSAHASQGIKETEYIKSCSFSHFREEIYLNKAGWQQVWQFALEEARQLELGLELALHFDKLDQVPRFLDASTSGLSQIKAFILYFPAGMSGIEEQENLIKQCRQRLPGVEIGIGTSGFFADINRNRPHKGTHDFIVFSVNPQVHAFDNATLIENLEAQRYPLETARLFLQGKKIHVSPVTLRPRFSQEDYSPDILPFSDDSRQISLFTAGWTIGSLKYMAENGVASLTYFETTGKRGIMADQRQEKNTLVPSALHHLYPVFFVFRELAAWKEADVISSVSDLPLQVSSLLLKKESKVVLFLANHTQSQVTVDISAFGLTWAARQMDAATFKQATTPDAFIQKMPVKVGNQLILSPFAFSVLTADVE